MKNKALIFVTSLLLVACWDTKNNTQQKEEEPKDSLVQTEKITFSSSHFKIKKKIFDTEIPNYKIDIKVEYATGKSEAAQLINKQLVALLFDTTIMPFEKAKSHYTDSLCNVFEKDLKELYDPDYDCQSTYEYEFSQEGEVQKNTPKGIISYMSWIQDYQGGAHGGAYSCYLNFHEATGKIVTCDELFGKSKAAVCKLIKEQIVKDYECKTAAELEEKTSIFSLGEVYISNNNFSIEKESILFCYNPYEIAPWSEGTIYTRLSFKQLHGLINLDVINSK